MTRRGSGLAARFREAAQRIDASRSEDEQRAAQRLAEAREERAALLADIQALGADLPLDAVVATEAGVVYRRAGVELRFLCDDQDGGTGLVVTSTHQEADDRQRIFRQPELGNRWVWSRVRRGRESRLSLFDQALELLLVHGLGLPDPGAGAVDAHEPSPEPSDDRRKTL